MSNEDHTTHTGPHVHASTKSKFCWVRVPKCGSCTISAALADIGDDNLDYNEFSAPHTIWDEYFKFAFVRNPWDRLRSCYHNKVESPRGSCSDYLHSFAKTNISFSDWVKTITTGENIFKDRHFAPMHTLMINRSFESMDFIGRLENLQQDFNIVCDKIGIPQRQLLHKNQTKHKDYTEYYDNETRQLVREKYAKDINYFGYKFGE